MIDKYNIRSANSNDIEALHEIFTEYWQALTGVKKFSLDDFRNIFSTPGFSMESSTQIIFSQDGEAIAGGVVIDLGSTPIHPSFYGSVCEGYEGQGIGTFLLGWGEARARQAIDRCPEGARVSMYCQTSPSHHPTIKLFERMGLEPVRYSWFMMKELGETPRKPVWPENIRITTFAEQSDIETILRAADEAFEDHWGHVDRSGDNQRIERFKHSVESDEAFDPRLWHLAMEGKEIAGVALCSPRLGPDHETGVVDMLGVRRPWRRKGLGLALLLHSFDVFFQRGYKQVGLGVDTQNLSGATRLYQKAGMQIAREFVVYEKELREGEEISVQSN